jgi:hypothetical protein
VTLLESCFADERVLHFHASELTGLGRGRRRPAERRFLEFFAAQIRNTHTRRVYIHAVTFLASDVDINLAGENGEPCVDRDDSAL